MSDFQTMKARIADEMKRGEITACATAVGRAVISAIQFFETERFEWNEFRDETHTTTQDDPYMSITATLRIVSLDSVKVVIGSRDYPLTEWNWHAMEAIDSGQWAGYPENYAWYAEQIRFYPIPNNAYTVKLAGIRRLNEISLSAVGTASNGWMVNGEEMVRLQAKAVLFRDEVRAPTTAAAMFTEAERAKRRARRTITAKQGSRVRPMYF